MGDVNGPLGRHRPDPDDWTGRSGGEPEGELDDLDAWHPLDRDSGGVVPELEEIPADADHEAFDRGEWPFDDDPPDPL